MPKSHAAALVDAVLVLVCLGMLGVGVEKAQGHQSTTAAPSVYHKVLGDSPTGHNASIDISLRLVGDDYKFEFDKRVQRLDGVCGGNWSPTPGIYYQYDRRSMSSTGAPLTDWQNNMTSFGWDHSGTTCTGGLYESHMNASSANWQLYPSPHGAVRVRGMPSNVVIAEFASITPTWAGAETPVLNATPAGMDSIQLDWTSSTSPASFELERRASGDSTYSLISSPAGSVRTFRDSNLSTNASYDYRIRGKTTYGVHGDYSNTATATTWTLEKGLICAVMADCGGQTDTCTQSSAQGGSSQKSNINDIDIGTIEPTSSSSDPGSLPSSREETSYGAGESLVVLERALPLSHIVESLPSGTPRPLMFWHAGPPRGVFTSRSLDLEAATEAYRHLYSAAHGNGQEPQVFALRVEGPLLAAQFKQPVQDLVEEIHEITAVSTAVVRPPGTSGPRTRIIAASSEEGPAPNEEATSSMSSTEAAEPWAPQSGSVDGGLIDCEETPRQIVHTLQWADRASLNAFGENAYEHDFKLFKEKEFGDGYARPFCFPWSQNDFWATRDGAIWDWTFPDDAGAYVDTEATDKCENMDLTVGLMDPRDGLDPAIGYSITLRTTGASHISSSEFGLSAASMPIDCPEDVQKPICVNLRQAGENEPLVSRSPGRTMPSCWDWDLPADPLAC